jgi:hypothetical protein
MSKKDLRAAGYMTSDEFIETILPGMKEYINKNWGFAGKNELHHPEDLIMNMQIYCEIAYHVLVDFRAAWLDPSEK